MQDIYKLTAEKLSAASAQEVLEHYPAAFATHRNPGHTDREVYVRGTRKDAEMVKVAIHSRNGGASCTIELMPEEEE
jgi:hypothetical protein